MILQAPAKINLTLDVTGKREDGYHNVKMIMETVSLYDTINIKKSNKISLKCNLSYVPTDEKNIAFKAALLFFEKTGIKGGADIDILKRIPVAAGMAGGSTDGAAVLKGLNKIYNLPLSREELYEIASKLGADVPYCIDGRPALAEGIGDVLTPLGNMPKTYVLLVKPNISLSTKWVYSQLDVNKISVRPDTEGAISDLQSGNIYALSKKLYNVLEEVSAEKYTVIKEIKDKMLELGALGSIMSGSGPTVFGIFDDEQKAKNAKNELYSQYPFVYLAHTL